MRTWGHERHDSIVIYRTWGHEIWLGLKAQHAWIETCENLTWEYIPCIYA